MSTGSPSVSLLAPKRALKAGFRALGLEVHHIPKEPEPPSPPPLFDDPYEALHYQRGGKDAAFACPLDQCVMFNGFSFAPQGWNPFTATLQEYRQGNCHSYEGSLLEKYYASWQPENALEALLGLENEPSALAHLPHFALVSPWTARTIDESIDAVRAWYSAEMREHEKPHLRLETHGFKLHGQVHPEVGRLEFSRLKRVFDSITTRGYVREGRDVDVLMVQRGSEPRYLFRHGMHRMAAMSALGYRTIPVRFCRLPFSVDVEDVDYWPQVRRGVWSTRAARQYIDHLFDFDAAAWARRKGLPAPGPHPVNP